ncbi:hypothetical protein CARUB_v10025411mg [Capsella rubella]|uniref:MADS-box domain-containing protein n=1 Tax=Capsella rubella TaxID=81985 RepID=R0G177_9BRAS|nr:agamous-like MADS-box protein AGL80 [Capsella rubella]EOA29142.1 hypothetical protein CARUB_v10025411mg [Capsella rubella]
MAKVKLAWVENNKARAMIFKRKSEGLLKQVKELTILCDIWACLIIFSPYEAEPVVWPCVKTVRGLLKNFFAKPLLEQKKKQTCLKSYLKEKIKTIHKNLMKSQQKNKEYVTEQLMIQLHHGRRISDLNLSEIYQLLAFSKDKIILGRLELDFMEFAPLRDPPVLLFEVPDEQLMIITNDAIV